MSRLQRATASAASAAGAEIMIEEEISSGDFARVAELVFELSGIVIKDHKRHMIYARLARRLRALKMERFGAYLDFVASPAGKDEVGELINAVTTNLTSFFRESHHFDHLASEILAPAVASGAGRQRIWSSAASSGEEPYSIAMTVRDVLGSRRPTDWRILATDLDTNMLATGQRGLYAEGRLKGVPHHFVDKYTKKSNDDTVEMAQELKSLLTFKQLNLLHEWPVKGPFDAIFCRNVLIYFDAATKRNIVDRLAQLVRPEGALYLGHSESLLGEHPLLISEGRTIYRRKSS